MVHLLLIDHHFRRIANLCDYKTAIQLARLENVDSRMFFPPINIHVRTGDIFQILLDLYKQFPSDLCNSFFATMVIKKRERFKSVESSLEEELKEKYLSRRGLNLMCLQTITRYSLLGEECCRLMVDKGLLSCLLTLRDAFIDDADLIAVIAKLLSQISQYDFARKHFYITGWLGILTEWMQSNDVRIKLPATKALYNLGVDDTVLGNHLYLLHPIYSGENSKYDVIFIHGLLGSIFRTWRQADSEKERQDYTKCWPQAWLSNDIKGLRILAVDYLSALVERKGTCIPEKRSLEDRGETLIQELLAAGVGKRPVIMVGHSMGGLLIKQMLVNCAHSTDEIRKNLLDQIKGIVFYSVPHRGSELARLSYNYQRISLPSQEVRELIKGKLDLISSLYNLRLCAYFADSPRLLELHDQFSRVAASKPKIRFLSFAETDKIRIGVKGVKLETILVSPESAYLGIGPFRKLPENHFNTCKPVDQSSACYLDLRNFIRDIIDDTDTFLSNNPKEWLKKWFQASHQS